MYSPPSPPSEVFYPELPLPLNHQLPSRSCLGLPKRYLNAQYKTTILPIVLPIVLYNGPKRYKGPRTLLEAYPKPTLLLHTLKANFLVPLNETSIEELLQGGAEAPAELLLKAGGSGQMDALFAQRGKAIANLLRQSSYKVAAACYAAIKSQQEIQLFLEKFCTLGPETKEEVMGAVERIMERDRVTSHAKGLAEGLSKGRAEGLSKGLSQGRAQLLKELHQAGVIDQTLATSLL